MGRGAGSSGEGEADRVPGVEAEASPAEGEAAGGESVQAGESVTWPTVELGITLEVNEFTMVVDEGPNAGAEIQVLTGDAAIFDAGAADCLVHEREAGYAVRLDVGDKGLVLVIDKRLAGFFASILMTWALQMQEHEEEGLC